MTNFAKHNKTNIIASICLYYYYRENCIQIEIKLFYVGECKQQKTHLIFFFSAGYLIGNLFYIMVQTHDLFHEIGHIL